MQLRTRALTTGVAAAALALAGTVSGPALASLNEPVTMTVVLAHLNNPRGLALAPDGSLLLAEAGNGGSQCLAGVGPGGSTECIGYSGSFDKITNLSGTAVRTRLVHGLFSEADPHGVGAEGPVAITTGAGTFGLFGVNSTATPPNNAIARSQVGQLAMIRNTTMTVAGSPGNGVGDQDYRWSGANKALNPKQFPDANPNGVLVVPGHVYVVDAGANTLNEIVNGVSHVLTYFPVPAGAPTDAVPTCVAQGPDGALYVGELLGGYYAPGHARIWRVVPGQAPTVWASGLTTVQGCGFTPDGAFYAVEFQASGFAPGQGNPAGAVVQIINGMKTTLSLGNALTAPAGFAPAPGHGIFVSNCSVSPQGGMGQLCPNGGEVVRIG